MQREPLTASECMRLLGLGEAASIGDIKRSYRRLAKECHPDKHGGDESARIRFSRVATAYRTLMSSLRAVKAGKAVGPCWECREFGEVVPGLDGHARCPRCLLNGPKRLLPLPVVIVARCTGTIMLLILSGYLLVQGVSTGRMDYAAGSLIAGACSLLLLTYTCLRLVYCVDARLPGSPLSQRGTRQPVVRRGKRTRRLSDSSGDISSNPSEQTPQATPGPPAG